MVRRRRRRTDDDPLDVYRRIRKPVPPPGRVEEDRRREIREREAEREAHRELEDPER